LNKKALVILATALLAVLAGGCASTQEQGQVAQAPVEKDKPMMRPWGGVGSYGGYTYRRYD
jgi:hypothetical protein